MSVPASPCKRGRVEALSGDVDTDVGTVVKRATCCLLDVAARPSAGGRAQPGDASRVLALVIFSELLDRPVVGGAQGCAVRLAPAVEHGDRWLCQPAFSQLVVGSVLEQAEEPELLPARAGQTDRVLAGHLAMHGLPLATA